MAPSNKSIEQFIQILAKNTHASNFFVDKVKTMFTEKKIALNADVTPFKIALREAFARFQIQTEKRFREFHEENRYREIMTRLQKATSEKEQEKPKTQDEAMCTLPFESDKGPTKPMVPGPDDLN